MRRGEERGEPAGIQTAAAAHPGAEVEAEWTDPPDGVGNVLRLEAAGQTGLSMVSTTRRLKFQS